jgi:hypothetical protein
VRDRSHIETEILTDSICSDIFLCFCVLRCWQPPRHLEKVVMSGSRALQMQCGNTCGCLRCKIKFQLYPCIVHVYAPDLCFFQIDPFGHFDYGFGKFGFWQRGLIGWGASVIWCQDAKNQDVENVLILSGDHLYRMDYMDFVQVSLSRPSLSFSLLCVDITICCWFWNLLICIFLQFTCQIGVHWDSSSGCKLLLTAVRNHNVANANMNLASL